VAGVQVKILKTEEECPLEEKQLLEVELLGYYLQYFCGENQMLTYFGTNESRKWHLKRKKSLTAAEKKKANL
jgi:hypothetical protein